jgi:hypothetical protein
VANRRARYEPVTSWHGNRALQLPGILAGLGLVIERNNSSLTEHIDQSSGHITTYGVSAIIWGALALLVGGACGPAVSRRVAACSVLADRDGEPDGTRLRKDGGVSVLTLEHVVVPQVVERGRVVEEERRALPRRDDRARDRLGMRMLRLRPVR